MEAQTFLLLNRAKNYADYLNAIRHFNCPGQNFDFASKANEIAWWQQANFPAKWRRQGEYVMPGWDSTYAWKYRIPEQDNINMVNPVRGFVASANQLPADTLYPFFLGGMHDLYRGIIINRYLNGMSGISVLDMQKMQTDNYNVFAETARPLLLRHIIRNQLDEKAKALLATVESWNLRSDIDEEGPTIFVEWWQSLSKKIWTDNITRPDSFPVVNPQAATLLEALLRDSNYVFIDNIHTPQVETLSEMVTTAFNESVPKLDTINRKWADYKATGVRHLISALAPFSRLNLPIGGGTHIINAATGGWGPSWRVIVHMTDETEAYGIYPGGQNGNPGSKYYDQFIDKWAKGEYNKLWIMKPEETESKNTFWKMVFSPGKSKNG
jgi:penicillin amidase